MSESQKMIEALNRKLELPENFPMRIRYCRMYSGETLKSMATKMGLGNGTFVGHWEAGRTGPSPERLALFCKSTGFKMDWVKHGRGEPREKTNFDQQVKAASVMETAFSRSPNGVRPRKRSKVSDGAFKTLVTKDVKYAEKIPFINRVRECLVDNNMTIKNIAEKMGTSSQAINLWLSPQQKPPAEIRLYALCGVFNVHHEWLKDGTGPKEKAREIVKEVPAEAPAEIVVEAKPIEGGLDVEAAIHILPSPATVTGDITPKLIARKLNEALERRRDAQEDIDEWTAILVNQV